MQKKYTVNGLSAVLSDCPGLGQRSEKKSGILFTIMKLTLVQITLAMIFSGVSIAFDNHAQEILKREVSLEAKDVPLVQLLCEIEKAANVKFVYSPARINLDEKVSLQVSQQKLGVLLSELFIPRSIKFEVQEGDDYIVLIEGEKVDLSLLLPEDSVQEEIIALNISGKVTDETGGPMPGVNIVQKGTTNGTTTDVNGFYSLALEEDDAILVFSFIGYTSQEIPVNGRTVIDVTLAEDVQNLSEVVIVGYGTQKKALVTGAISSVKASELSNTSVTTVDQALQGRIAGVSVSSNSGMPGEGMKVRIRGVGSNGNSDPLYIVDGIVVGNLNNIDPSEIGSIEVLKDAASAAIYGAQGANGVVMITTKTGNKNTAPTIDFAAQYGSSSLRNLPKMMDATEYTTYLREAGLPNVPDPAGSSTDWMKAIIKPATIQRYTLNIAGGTDKSTYLVGGSASSQQGIIGGPKAEFTRYSFRVNSDHNIKPWLKIGERLSYSNSIRTSLPQEGTASLVGGAVMMDPLTPIVYEGALPSNVQNAIANGYEPVTDDNGNYYGIGTFPSNEYSNPRALLQINHASNKTYNFAGNVYMDIEPLEGLKFTTRYGIDSYFTNSRDWSPSYWMGPYKYSTIASVYNAANNGLRWQWENFFNYQKTIGDHNFNILGGVSAAKSTWNGMGTTGRGLEQETDKFAEIDYVSSTVYTATGSQGSTTLQSYYGRVQYDFAGKYLFNSTIRRDGSSIMAPGHQWGIFPSVSAGWVLSEEDFFASKISSAIINNLKIRASWGQNGSISNVSVGAWNSMIHTGFGLNYPVDDNTALPGAEPNNLPNYDLKWETSEQTDIGIDMNLLGNRITIAVDYFNKITKDLLTPGVSPGYTGFALPYINGGNVRNRGFEFELGARSDNKPFKYDASFNVTRIKNMVTYLNPIYPRIINGINRITYSAFEKGYPIWYFYGYKTAGIFQNQTQIDDYISDNNLTGYDPVPGDPIIVNTKDDGLISTDDQTYIGSPYPDYTFGTRLNFSYKGFDLLVFAQGQVGNKIILAFNRTDLPYSNKLQYWFTQRWTGENSTNSFFRANVDNPFIYGGDMLLFDGSYMRIKQLQLGYTLPGSMLQKIAIQSVRLYVSVDDYFTFTKYPGMDPEGGTSNEQAYSVDNMMYPVSGKIMFGLNCKF